MRWLALSGLCGCSLIYNPNNLPAKPPADAMPDAEIIFDADPTMLSLIDVSPPLLYEGQGDHGRAVVVTVSGHHMVKSNTTVEIAVHGNARPAMIMVDNAQLDVAADGDMLSVPVTLPVDTSLAATEQLALDVTVKQDTPAGPITKTIAGKLALQGLAEADDAHLPMLTNPPTMYSKITLSGALAVPGPSMAPTTYAMALRATSTITITGGAALSANGMAAGPGGGVGGKGGGTVLGSQPGTPGGGFAGGAAGVGGGWRGNDQLTTLADPNRGSGGGGGNGSALQGGGNGGASGGSIELTAGGDLTVGAVRADGAPGVTQNVANPGGAGSGGAILLRSTGGKVVMNGAVTADSGGGSGVAMGAPGKIRIDTPLAFTGGPAAYFRGPTFATTTPLIVRTASPTLTITAQGGRNIQYYTSTADGTDTHGPVTMLMPANGMTAFQMQIELFRGTNRLCAMVEGGTASTPEAGNCITISYLYTP